MQEMNEAVQHVESLPPPGWDELLHDVSCGERGDLSVKEWDRIESAANSISMAIAGGFAAIGELQWRACCDPGNLPDPDVFFRLGVFQTALAELLESLAMTEKDAAFYKHKQELARLGRPPDER